MRKFESTLVEIIPLLIALELLILFGCKAPVTFSPLVTSEININDSVKGNTVTPLP